MQPIPVFNPAATAAGYAAAIAANRTAQEVQRQTEMLEREFHTLQESIRKSEVAARKSEAAEQKARRESAAREDQLRKIDLWTREYEHRGFSPLDASSEAHREWQRLQVLKNAQQFASMINKRVPSVPTTQEYRAFRESVERELRASLPARGRWETTNLLACLFLTTSIVFGLLMLLFVHLQGLSGHEVAIYLAICLFGGALLAALWALVGPRLHRRQAQRNAAAVRSLQQGLETIPNQPTWLLSVFRGRCIGFTKVTSRTSRRLEGQFERLGPSLELDDEIVAVRKSYMSTIADVNKQLAEKSSLLETEILGMSGDHNSDVAAVDNRFVWWPLVAWTVGLLTLLIPTGLVVGGALVSGSSRVL